MSSRLDERAQAEERKRSRAREKLKDRKPNGAHGPNGAIPNDDPQSFQFVPLQSLLKSVRGTDYLIKPYLERNTVAVLFGESMAFKSFVALDIALCVAHGYPYHGHPTKQGSVFYIAGEGHQGIGRRVLAWRIARQIPADNDAPFFVSALPGRLIEATNTALIMQAIKDLAEKHGAPALIEIDTAAANMGSGDENSNSDVGAFLANIAMMLRAPFGATVLIVHHVGWSEKGRTRGAYAFLGNADCQIQAERCFDHSKRIVTLTCRKTKDAPAWDPVSFEARLVSLGIQDSEGADESSLVMDRVDYTPTDDSLTTQQRSALNLLYDMYQRQEDNIRDQCLAGPARVRLSDWQRACVDAGLINTRGKAHDEETQKNRAFYKLRDRLKEKGLINVVFPYVYPPPSGPDRDPGSGSPSTVPFCPPLKGGGTKGTSTGGPNGTLGTQKSGDRGQKGDFETVTRIKDGKRGEVIDIQGDILTVDLGGGDLAKWLKSEVKH